MSLLIPWTGGGFAGGTARTLAPRRTALLAIGLYALSHLTFALVRLLLSDAKLAEDPVEDLLDIHPAGDPPQRPGREP